MHMGKVFKLIRGTYVLEPNFITFAALQSQLTQSQFTWKTKSGVLFLE